MATPNFKQIQSFGNVTNQLQEAAIDEFMEYVHSGMTIEEVTEIAVDIAMKFSMLGSELGAQWYDLCSELAGLDVEPAELSEFDESQIRSRVKYQVDNAPADSTIGDVVNKFLQDQVQRSIRTTGTANLWRDYERGMAGGRWARVPVGDTCAWCLMLASNGAWYLSEESAIGADPGHYHDGCNCIAVYHANAESIAGYSKQLESYKAKYYDAENARSANANGKQLYDEELKARVDRAKAIHKEKFDAGETDIPWTKYNETLIVMRYQNPGLH